MQNQFRAEPAALGIAAIAAGALLLLNNFGLLEFGDFWRYWPALLIAWGIVRLVENTPRHSHAFGAILIAFGVLLMARNLGVHLNVHILAPLALIAIGAGILVKRIAGGEYR